MGQAEERAGRPHPAPRESLAIYFRKVYRRGIMRHKGDTLKRYKSYVGNGINVREKRKNSQSA